MDQKPDFFYSDYQISNSLELCKKSIPILENILFDIKNNLISLLDEKGGLTSSILEKEQFLTHGFAWIATYVESLNQLASWAERLQRKNKFNLAESLILQIGFAEYIAQIKGGIQMSQSETIRSEEMSQPILLLISQPITMATWIAPIS